MKKFKSSIEEMLNIFKEEIISFINDKINILLLSLKTKNEGIRYKLVNWSETAFYEFNSVPEYFTSKRQINVGEIVLIRGTFFSHYNLKIEEIYYDVAENVTYLVFKNIDTLYSYSAFGINYKSESIKNNLYKLYVDNRHKPEKEVIEIIYDKLVKTRRNLFANKNAAENYISWMIKSFEKDR